MTTGALPIDTQALPQPADGALAPRAPRRGRWSWTGHLVGPEDLGDVAQTLTPAAILFLAAGQAQANPPPPDATSLGTPPPAVRTTAGDLGSRSIFSRGAGQALFPSPSGTRSKPTPPPFPEDGPGTPPPARRSAPGNLGARSTFTRGAGQVLFPSPSGTRELPDPPPPPPDPELGDWRQYGSTAYFRVWQRWEQFHFATRRNVEAAANQFDRILPNPYGISARTVAAWLDFWDYGDPT